VRPSTYRTESHGKPPIKTYVAVLVCFLSKAVHLELVVDLSSDSFLSVFKKFAGRRYLPEQMYSDNATNFMGAKFRSRSDGTRLNEESSGRVVCWENIKLQCYVTEILTESRSAKISAVKTAVWYHRRTKAALRKIESV